MYIVPFGIFMVLQAVMAGPEKGQAAAGETGGQQAAAR